MIVKIPAQLEKRDIAKCREFWGTTNSAVIKHDGAVFLTDSLCYQGFAGALDRTIGMYVGIHRFKLVPVGISEGASVDFTLVLPGLRSVTTVADTESEEG